MYNNNNNNAEKWHHCQIRIAINDESQGSIAKKLRCDELLYYTSIIHCAGERIFKIGEHDHVQNFAATAVLCCGSCVQWVTGFFIWPM